MGARDKKMSDLVREEDVLQTSLDEMFKDTLKETKMPDLVREEELMQISVDELFRAEKITMLDSMTIQRVILA